MLTVMKSVIATKPNANGPSISLTMYLSRICRPNEKPRRRTCGSGSQCPPESQSRRSAAPWPMSAGEGLGRRLVANAGRPGRALSMILRMRSRGAIERRHVAHVRPRLCERRNAVILRDRAGARVVRREREADVAAILAEEIGEKRGAAGDVLLG